MALTPAQHAFCTRYLGRGRSGRLEGASRILQDIADLDIPDEATERERSAVTDLTRNARALLDESATDKELTAAKGLLEQAEAKLRDIGDRLNKARAAAATLQTRLMDLPRQLPKATPSETRKAFEADIAARLDTLKGAPATETLRAAADALPGLLQRIEEVKDALAREQKERDDTAAALAEQGRKTAATLDADALPGMTEQRDTQLKILAANETPPVSPDALMAVTGAKDALEALVSDTASRMEALRDIRDLATPILARLAQEASQLTPHSRAPQAQSAAILQDAKTLREAHAGLTNLADIDKAGHTRDVVNALAAKVDALEARMTTLNSETEAAIATVEDARARASEAVTHPKGRAFSKTQQDAFNGQIEAQIARFDSDLTAAETVAAELDKLAAGFAALSTALKAYEQRINAVPRPAADTLATRETASLNAAEKAACDALDEVLAL